ncbi:MAG: tetratricopeptide repeat protein [Candidatus Omnitrophica bacterium]|nr:tetratricopeptide repeat protein [Candidatus Omnitrophota bacterium]
MRPRLNKIFIPAAVLAAGYLFYACAAGKPNFFTRHVQYQRERAKAKIRLIELNYLIPSYKSMTAFARGEAGSASVEWDKYMAYYQKVAELMPRRADVYVFLGYCYYYQNQPAQAALFFEKALMLDPNFFWAYYDLGLMAAQEGDCPVAAGVFSRGLNIGPQQAVRSMLASKLYLDIRAETADFNQVFERHLKAAYGNAAHLGALAAQCGHGDARAGQDLRAQALKAQIQVF